MAYFCPNCHNLVSIHVEGNVFFYCRTCNYKFRLKHKIYSKLDCTQFNKLVSTDAIDADTKNMSKTQAICPKCTHDEAYFYSMQTRSADEPSTLFYICVQCNNHWKE